MQTINYNKSNTKLNIDIVSGMSMFTGGMLIACHVTPLGPIFAVVGISMFATNCYI